MADLKSFPVQKVQDQSRRMKAPRPLGGNSDVGMDTPKPWGATKNPSASPDPMFGREFNTEADLQAVIYANSIRANKARWGKVVSLAKSRMVPEPTGKERPTGMNLKNAGGGSIGERKGANNAGVRGRPLNSFDHRDAPSKPSHGTKMDGGKGRW